MKKLICCLGLFLFARTVYSSPISSLEFQVNVGNWLESCSEKITSNKTCTGLVDMGVSIVAMSIFQNEGKSFAVAKIKTSLSDAQTAWMSNTNLTQLVQVADNEFRWVSAETNDTAFPMCDPESMRIRFAGDTILIADSNRFAFAEAMDLSTNTIQLVKGSIRVADLLAPLWDAADNAIAKQEAGFGKVIMSAILKSAKDQMASIQDIPSIAIDIKSPSHDTRTMTLDLEFNDPSSSKTIISLLNWAADAWKDPSITEKQLSLFGLTDTLYFRNATSAQNTLRVIYEWPSTKDADVWKLVAGSVVGGLFSFGDSDSYPVHEESIMQAPVLKNISGFDPVQIETDICSSIFLDYVWSDSVSLSVEYLSIPNADLLEGTLTDIHMMSTTGVDVANTERPGSFGYNSDTKSGSIRLSTLKDGPTADSASFTLNLNVPVEVEQFILSKENPLIEQDGKGLCLLSISNSVIQLRSKGISLSESHIYALNEKGEFLNSKGSSRSKSHFRGEYRGAPAMVKVVQSAKTESVVIPFTNFPVNKESILKLSSAPTNTVVTRYAATSAKGYLNPDVDAVTKSSISLRANGTPALCFPISPCTKVKKTTIQSYLTGTKEFMYRGHSGGFSMSQGNVIWTLKPTNALGRASAIFGEAEIPLRTGISACSIDVSTNAVPLIPNQDLPAASVEYNVVWVENTSEGEVLEIQAFDLTGRPLKKDNRTSWKNKKTGSHFWGMPTRVTITYSTSATNIVIPFEIELKDGGLEEILAVRKKIIPFEEFISEVKEINQKSRRCGTLLSGNYYMTGQDNKPMANISQEIARSDPAGAEVFGYDLTPYKGYIFQRIPTEDGLKKERELKEHKWIGGSFESTGSSGTGALLATPVDPEDPAILIRWSSAYVNYNDCSEFKVVPSFSRGMEKAGWIQLR
jgi:hypothetical protein